MVSKKILITPLNWGLGHATRDIPIIRALIQNGHEVHLGSDGMALALLKAEFPDLPAIELPGYAIHYKGKNLVASLFRQFPSMIRAVVGENRVIKRYVRQHGIDTIISDNRFGCISSKTRNIFVSHQLRILMRPKLFSWIVTKVNQFFIKRFDACWIPDHPGNGNFSGTMSSVRGIKKAVYIGPVSRFKALDLPVIYDFVAVLSGPEPSRTNLEEILVSQASVLPYKIMIVRGLPGANDNLKLPDHLKSVNFLTTNALNEVICQSKYVISRTGYTTLLDLAVMQKTGILIPTPGQPEQEYLATVQSEKGRFVIGYQKDLNLAMLIDALTAHPPASSPTLPDNLLQKAMDASGL